MPKKYHQIPIALFITSIIAVAINLTLGTKVLAVETEALLTDVIEGPHRSESNRNRDLYRHPKETLLFFGLKPDMTAIEISPGSGWYSEIIAPVLKSQGRFIAAVPKTNDQMPEPMKRRDATYRQMISSDTFLYGMPGIIDFDSAAPSFGQNGSADMVLTFRNVHNWAKAGHTRQMFSAFYQALKKGGILGIVEHRARQGTPIEKQVESGYMTEAYVIEAAKSVGFKLVASSAINDNPLDTKDHPGGVWNLPPSLRDVAEKDRAKYIAIGESDRMTLKFIKP